jgi:hypothetical protein
MEEAWGPAPLTGNHTTPRRVETAADTTLVEKEGDGRLKRPILALVTVSLSIDLISFACTGEGTVKPTPSSESMRGGTLRLGWVDFGRIEGRTVVSSRCLAWIRRGMGLVSASFLCARNRMAHG